MRLILFLFLSSVSALYAQKNYEGTWTGIIARTNQTWSQGNTFSISISKTKDRFEAISREEINTNDFFGLAKAYGEEKEDKLLLKQILYTEKKGSIRTTWCKLELKLTLNDSTGYLQGEFVSNDCRQSVGKMILYRIGNEINDLSKTINSPQITERLSIDLKRGRNAPEIRAVEREKFTFQPVYFDYDKADIRTEYFDFLRKMIDIVDGHSDLRIKVVGNTDADGSDKYNEELSKKRAQVIVDFFVQNGLSPDRVEIEYYGEKKPADSNETEQGKQLNRRVEFMFI